MRNFPQRLRPLSIWSTVGDPVCRGYREVVPCFRNYFTVGRPEEFKASHHVQFI